jgi:hypothetical protein
MARPQARRSKFLSLGRLPARLLRIPLKEASFAVRGFRGCDGQARQRLEKIGVTFLLGYHAALEEQDSATLVQHLDRIDRELRGFAFEGAAMGLALLDLLTPWKKDRWLSFFENGAAVHQYMTHVGVGWALARLQRWRKTHPSLIDPLLRWLAIDGYGFHEGYFHWRQFIDARAVPHRLSDYELRVFDQGLGRSIWFVEGGDVERIPATIESFPVLRQADIWSGVGLACAYAGGVDRSAIESLRDAAAPFAAHVAQGVAFAAKTRQKAGNSAAHTTLACEVLCGLSADVAAGITDAALIDLPVDGQVPAYEIWRQRIQAYFL